MMHIVPNFHSVAYYLTHLGKIRRRYKIPQMGQSRANIFSLGNAKANNEIAHVYNSLSFNSFGCRLMLSHNM